MRLQFVMPFVGCLVLGLSSVMFLTAQEPAVSRTEMVGIPAVPSRVVEAIDENKRVVLTGNIHPTLGAALERGLVDAQLPLERMQLVLRRSPEQEAALEAFMAEQLDPKSPNFHHWLHAEEFGKIYGPSDSDMAAVSNWLQNHGFRIDQVSKGRVTIEFSGTASQVQVAFHTEIHNYLVNGKMHIANNRDPEIPEALAPVITGIASLHDFFPRHQSELGRIVSKDSKTGKITPVDFASREPKPSYVFTDPSNGIPNEDIGPYDFAAIYNLLPLWNAGITGKGQSIAIASQTDITLSDITTFRKFFGLSKFAGTVKQVINGADPGIIQGSVVENTLDTEWSGATAPDAEVITVASKGTATSAGGSLSISYIIDNEIAPVMSASYGECEAGLGKAGNAALNAIFQQGSAEGISLFESAGDQGSTGCDNSDATTYPNPAQNGLQVNGFVSNPYITGVGGTDFVWQEQAYSKYWTANTANNSSAIGYIPEVPWNSTCTDYYLLTYVYTGQKSYEELCNNAYNAGLDDMIRVVGGSGGKSSCLSNTGTFASCSGSYPKPAWQKGTGVPADGVRDVPDVSFFASSGLPSGNGGSAYLICVSSNSPDKTCDYTGENITAQEVGGTSVSSPAMAGIMALVLQKTGKAQGLANPVFYQLAAKENLASCNSNTVANGNSCIFYDTTSGNNAMPCLTGSLNCTITTSGDEFGMVSGYTTTTGYDLATGLGSMNVTNLVNSWPSTAVTETVSVSPTSLTFASTTIGATTAAQVVTVKNTGTGAVTLSSETFTGTNASSFVKSATTCGTSLAVGASCTISVEFKPTVAGSLTASLSIADNATGSPQLVALKGTATAAALTVTVSPTSLTFASTAVGATSSAQTVTVKNTGTGAVTLSSETFTGTNASSFVKSATTCGTSLAAGASCTISVEFKPTVAGSLTASLSITDNATGSPQLVALKGTATASTTPTVTLTPASIAFPNTIVGQTSDAVIATLTNTGTASVTVSSITVSGASFLDLTDCGATLASKASCQIYVAFKPTAASAQTGSLSVADNATGSPQKISLTGTGTAAPSVKLSTTSITFPTTTHGTTSADVVVTLSNAGTATLTLSSISLTGANPTDFEALNTCGATLAPGANCTVYLAFKPAAASAYKATLSVVDDGGASPQSVALAGTGK